MDGCTIRMAGPDDIDDLVRVGRTSFAEAYGKFNAADDLQTHLVTSYCPERIRADMRSGESSYLIALVDQQPAGFGKLRLGPSPACIPGELAAEINQIYLLAEFQGQGVGRRLMDSLSDLARAGGADGVYLGVWERADWALRFYEKYGMKPCGSHSFVVGTSDQTDILMYIALPPDPLQQNR